MNIISFFLSIPLFCFYYLILSGITKSLGYSIYKKDKSKIALNMAYIAFIYVLSIFNIWFIFTEKVGIIVILNIIVTTAFVISIIPQNK